MPTKNPFCSPILPFTLFDVFAGITVRRRSFNTNLSASCVCPPACEVKHYTSAMSYATANEDTRPQQSVSAEYLERAGKHLNESIDTKENMLPKRRQANEEEAERVRNFLELNIYLRDLRVQEYEQLETYTVIVLLSDIGGSLGLLIGASVITLFEAADAFATALASRRHQKIKRPRRSSTQETDTKL
ncbi:hypothetical protein NP493_1651g00024 [Ridgeia piscesae]|uniref:Uncharacterized protein n=1 Tax=Ridgeia piscesae TaxID=27915 RepID=A0AAD9JY77_RIDPI|nr:hypothetical protein NP493_1651g00024 [Ridgeia piscesae]